MYQVENSRIVGTHCSTHLGRRRMTLRHNVRIGGTKPVLVIFMGPSSTRGGHLSMSEADKKGESDSPTLASSFAYISVHMRGPFSFQRCWPSSGHLVIVNGKSAKKLTWPVLRAAGRRRVMLIHPNPILSLGKGHYGKNGFFAFLRARSKKRSLRHGGVPAVTKGLIRFPDAGHLCWDTQLSQYAARAFWRPDEDADQVMCSTRQRQLGHNLFPRFCQSKRPVMCCLNGESVSNLRRTKLWCNDYCDYDESNCKGEFAGYGQLKC